MISVCTPGRGAIVATLWSPSWGRFRTLQKVRVGDRVRMGLTRNIQLFLGLQCRHGKLAKTISCASSLFYFSPFRRCYCYNKTPFFDPLGSQDSRLVGSGSHPWVAFNFRRTPQVTRGGTSGGTKGTYLPTPQRSSRICRSVVPSIKVDSPPVSRS